MKSSYFILTIIGLYGKWWLFAITSIFIIALTLGIAVDIRFLIISLMVLFLIAPMAMAMIFIVYGFSKDCSFNVAQHRLLIKENELVIEIADYFSVNESEKNEEEKFQKLNEICLPLECLDSYQVNKNSVIVRLRNKEKGFIYIPLEAFDGDIIKLQLFLTRLFRNAAIKR